MIYFGFTLILSADLCLAGGIILNCLKKGCVDVDWIHVTKGIKQEAGYFEWKWPSVMFHTGRQIFRLDERLPASPKNSTPWSLFSISILPAKCRTSGDSGWKFLISNPGQGHNFPLFFATQPWQLPATTSVRKTRDYNYSFDLLMMSGVSFETCWTIKKHWNNKFYYTVASCWLFQRGIRFAPICSHITLVLCAFLTSTEFQPRGTFFHCDNGSSRFPRNFGTLVPNQMFHIVVTLLKHKKVHRNL
jgi:hypothetical protein